MKWIKLNWIESHCIALHCNAMQFNSIQFNSIQFNSIQFNSIQFNSVQFNSIQCCSNSLHAYSPPLSSHIHHFVLFLLFFPHTRPTRTHSTKSKYSIARMYGTWEFPLPLSVLELRLIFSKNHSHQTKVNPPQQQISIHYYY